MESICRRFFFDAFGGRGKLTLLIERLMQDGTAKELYRSDLVELIRMHPYTRIQSELDRQDVYEVEISLIDDLDGDTDTYMQTAVTVSGGQSYCRIRKCDTL